jgi:integrase
MGRPPLPIGTAGDINVFATKTGHRAVCNYRDDDGVTRRIERHGTTPTKAKTRLREAIRERNHVDNAAEIIPDTTVSALAEIWRAELDERDLSPTTVQAYHDRLTKQILPALGALRLREITISRVDRFLKAVKKRHGASVAKMTRSVLSGMLGLAARHDALDRNPTRDAARLSTTTGSARAFTLDEARDLRAKLAADPVAIKHDLVDFVDMMLASGLRIGEAAAITWPALDLQAGTVEVRGTVIRVKGQGLQIKPKPKTKTGYRTLELPTWAIAMLQRRRATAKPNRWDAVFTAPLGGLRDPSNTQMVLRGALDHAGYPWASSHSCRKTVATLMDQGGLSARAAADQLGHAQVSTTQNYYYGRKTRRTGAAAILEAVAATPTPPAVRLDTNTLTTPGPPADARPDRADELCG